MARLLDASLPFSFSVRTDGPEVLVIATGELDLSCAPAVAEMFALAVTPTCRRVVIDASALTFIDCAGLRALLAGRQVANGTLEVVLRAPSSPVRRLLDLLDVGGLAVTGRPDFSEDPGRDDTPDAGTTPDGS